MHRLFAVALRRGHGALRRPALSHQSGEQLRQQSVPHTLVDEPRAQWRCVHTALQRLLALKHAVSVCAAHRRVHQRVMTEVVLAHNARIQRREVQCGDRLLVESAHWLYHHRTVVGLLPLVFRLFLLRVFGSSR